MTSEVMPSFRARAHADAHDDHADPPAVAGVLLAVLAATGSAAARGSTRRCWGRLRVTVAA